LAVDAMKLGAQDYLTKPVVLSELKLLIDRLLGDERKQEVLSYFQKREEQGSGVSSILGQSPPLVALREKISQLLATESKIVEGELPSVLVTGETGTGKEVVARALHFGGKRRGGPFIEINCAAIPSTLLEAELFGFERGAFTDARERKLGLVEAADGGSLFLDEIGDVDISMQAKLLKLLEERSVRRLGSLREKRVDVRIIAATNQPLEQMVREGKFRADLYFRLRVVQINTPPLRDRGEDILLLARHFLRISSARYGKRDLAFTPRAEQLLLAYTWPGNVRELRNAIEQSVLLTHGESVDAAQLAFCETLGDMDSGAGAEGCFALPVSGLDLEEVERDLVTQALARTSGNVTQSARLLGISRDALRYRIDKFKLRTPISE
jgi:DNA-binding NtrC family response regulator